MNASDETNSNHVANEYDSQNESLDNLRDPVVELTQQLSEERLLRDFLESVFHTIFEPILVLDDKMKIVLANSSYYKAFGGSDRNTLDASIYSSLSKKLDTPEIRNLLNETLASKGRMSNYKVAIESVSKGPRTYLINARIVSNPEGNNKFIMIAFDDATDRLRADAQRTTLMHEMNHRIKNNLNVIQALLKLQAKAVDDSVSKGYFNDTQARVQSISLIHEMLYHSVDLTKINFPEYLSKLLRSIAQCYSHSTVVTELNVPIINIDLNKMLPIGLIVTELVTNAYKYAFPENRTGKVIVQLISMNGKNLILTVKDNGIGIPHDFNINKTESFGMKIVTALVDQIRGELEIVRDGGTAFIIKFQDEELQDIHNK